MQKLRGKVVSGTGDLSEKMSCVAGLSEAYKRKLGVDLFPGSLNIRLESAWSMPAQRIRLEKEEYGGLVSMNILPCRIRGEDCLILRTDGNELGTGTHPKEIIEVASNVRLRDHFRLKDGDTIEVEIQ